MATSLSTRLSECEAIIERSRHGFVEFGNALLEIKTSKLWPETYTSFSDYCQKRWNFGKRYADHIIGSASTVAELRTIVPESVSLPETESQARELKSLPTAELKAEAYVEAVKAADGKTPTAKQVKESVAKISGGSKFDPVELDAAPANPKPIEKDKLGNPIPEHLLGVFAAAELFNDADGGFKAIKASIEKISHTPAYHHLNAHTTATDKYHVKGLEGIRYSVIYDGKPHCVCVNCDGTGKVRIDPCKSCKGCGWLTKHKYNQIKSNAQGEADIAARKAAKS